MRTSLMDIHLDTLLGFPDVTVESCTQELGNVFLKLYFLKDSANCPHCQQSSDDLHQTRSIGSSVSRVIIFPYLRSKLIAVFESCRSL
jgi:hypothetical protein